MKKLIVSFMLCLGLMTSFSSCATSAYATTPDTVIVDNSDAVTAAVITGVATAVLIDYVWAWNGSSYYRYPCRPYYAPRPYFYRGPRHHVPRYWRPMPPVRHRYVAPRPSMRSSTFHHRPGGHFGGHHGHHGGRR